MILVDTGIIIDFWKSPTDMMKRVLLEEKVAICGIVRAELMHGAKDKRDLSIISTALSDFEYISIEEPLWEDVGELLYRLRKKGITIPFQDVVISALCLKYNLSLWTNDKHFGFIKKEMRNLKLFKLRGEDV